jgi:exosortase
MAEKEKLSESLIAVPAFGARGGSPRAQGSQHPAASSWHIWGQLSILAVLLAFLYDRVLANLAAQWWTDPNYSHGFIIPVFCGWMVWKESKHLADEPEEPGRLGIFVILGALALLVVGSLGAELFLSRTSFIFLLAGLVIHFRGLGYFRRFLFPWALLFLAVPPPDILFNQIALPLQLLASWLASGLLALLGIPVLREGNVIDLPSLSLDVVAACSGLRSLISLITLAIFYGYFFESRIWMRVLLAMSAIPIAVAANGVRIMGSGLLGEYGDPARAQGFFHLFSGWVIFVLSMVLLVSLHRLLLLAGRFHNLREREA